MDSADTSSQILTIECGTVYFRDDQVICVDLKEDYTIEIKDLEQIVSSIQKLAIGNKYPVVTVGGKYTSFSYEVLREAADPKHHINTSALAFVIKSPHQRLLANFFVKVITPPIPTKYFEKLEEAVEWLKEQK